MDKQQYLNVLQNALKESFTQQQMNDILADYSEFFDAGIAEGKSESELCTEFGNPEKVALELMIETAGAKKVRFKKQCVKITAIVFIIAILAYSIFYLFQNGHPNNVILTFLLAILPQLIISIEISNRHADFSSTKTNKYRWMKKAVLICYPLICIVAGCLIYLLSTAKESLFNNQESTNFFAMGNYYLIMFSFLLLLFSSVLITMYSITVNSKVRFLLFLNVAFFGMFINIRFLLSNFDLPVNMLFTKSLPCVFEAFAQSLIIAVLFALFLYLQRKLKGEGVKRYERANEKGNS